MRAVAPISPAAPPASRRRNLAVRLATAAILVPPVFWLIARGGAGFALLVAFASGACTWEVYAMSLGGGRARFSPAVGLGVALGAAMPLLAWRGLYFRAAPLAAIGLFGAASATAVLSRGEIEGAAGDVSRLVSGWVYGALPLGLLPLLRARPEGAWWVLLLCALTWLNDTGAYFVGHAFGRHKLHPRVSPGKTWEGFAGGLVFSLLAAFGVRWIALRGLGALDCVVLGGVAGFVGPLGDLTESLFKRACGVKDSGRLMPGHGGMLDRIDALIFNTPVVYLYVVLVQGQPWR